ncbi:MAG: tRNA-dihydrouridine synthase [Halorhabdus sp.]
MTAGLLPFEPRVAAASLSGESDAGWARAAAPHVGAAFLGGLAIDGPTREAAHAMAENRDREEFLPADPFAFAARQLDALTAVPVVPGLNVRTSTTGPLHTVAAICAEQDAICEVNAHCRQTEMCETGAGQALLADPDRLATHVETAADTDATVSVKVRAEVAGVDLPAVARRVERAGADVIHVDAMDSERAIREVVAATDLFVIANNGVRNRATTREYLAYGADAVSVARASDRPAILDRVQQATRQWFEPSDEPNAEASR